MIRKQTCNALERSARALLVHVPMSTIGYAIPLPRTTRQVHENAVVKSVKTYRDPGRAKVVLQMIFILSAEIVLIALLVAG